MKGAGVSIGGTRHCYILQKRWHVRFVERVSNSVWLWARRQPDIRVAVTPEEFDRHLNRHQGEKSSG